jgi:hypothetical protein
MAGGAGPWAWPAAALVAGGMAAAPALAADGDGDRDDGGVGNDDRLGDDSERGGDREIGDRIDADDRADDGLEFEPDVVLAIDLSRAARIRARAMGFRVVDEYVLHDLGFRLAELSVPGGIPAQAALRRLRAADPVGIYDLNDRYSPSAAAAVAAHPGMDPCDGVRCDAQKAVHWPAAGCPQAVTVGMVDTAVAADSRALAGSRLLQKHFGNSGMSAAGAAHGSEIATQLVGRAAAGFAGLLPQASLLAADVFDYSRAGGEVTTALRLARGFNWLVGRRPAVINVAIAGPDNFVLRETVRRALAGGIPVVAAAGNLGPSGPPRYPAAYPDVIAVTAVDRYDRVYPQANQGAYIGLSAPGVDVWTADADGSGRFVSGTSFATPFVSADVALLHAADAGASPAAISALLRGRALDLGVPGVDPVFWAGLLQAHGCAPP